MASIDIVPIQIWYEGVNVTVNNLSLYSINDNLTTYSEFHYQLNFVSTDVIKQYVTGNLTCIGTDYINWRTANFDTNWILNWACSQLNLLTIHTEF
jgi:hypothetical protein